MYTADENLNDIRSDAAAYTNVWKVLVHSWATSRAGGHS
jgi:hypothetical protein